MTGLSQATPNSQSSSLLGNGMVGLGEARMLGRLPLQASIRSMRKQVQYVRRVVSRLQTVSRASKRLTWSAGTALATCAMSSSAWNMRTALPVYIQAAYPLPRPHSSCEMSSRHCTVSMSGRCIMRGQRVFCRLMSVCWPANLKQDQASALPKWPAHKASITLTLRSSTLSCGASQRWIVSVWWTMQNPG